MNSATIDFVPALYFLLSTNYYPPSMALSRLSKFWIAFALVAIFGLLWGTYFFYQLSPAASGSLSSAGQADFSSGVAPATTTVPLVITKGEGFAAIADRLAASGLVRSASAFKVYSIISGSAHQFKPGLYSFSSASSSISIVRSLVAGPAKEITVLIPEGHTLPEIDATLARYGVIQKGQLKALSPRLFREQYPFLDGAVSLEGFLFPDTYRFYFDSKPEEVARVMLDTFVAKVGPLVTDEGVVQYDTVPVLRRGVFSLREIVTIASMIESEVPQSADRKVVADILYRRLRIGMALQIDASRDYAVLMGDDRFDTYANPGLPRGPISNPGIDSLEAALTPKSSVYLYYISDPKTKKTIFAKDFEEHKKNIAKYL